LSGFERAVGSALITDGFNDIAGYFTISPLD
jgi:hypothetical protein